MRGFEVGVVVDVFVERGDYVGTCGAGCFFLVEGVGVGLGDDVY